MAVLASIGHFAASRGWTHAFHSIPFRLLWVIYSAGYPVEWGREGFETGA